MDVETLIRQYTEGIRYFSNIDLMEEDLSGVNLSEADLTWAWLDRANLSRANLSRAILRGAKLRDSNLRGADLSGADLSGADLSRARMEDTNLAVSNLKGVKGSFSCEGAFFCKTIDPRGTSLKIPRSTNDIRIRNPSSDLGSIT
jgi:uncharacterized protein YjbI with pentapeptide repeats